MNKKIDYMIGIMCLIVVIMLALNLSEIPSEKIMYICIFILLSNLFFGRKVDE